VIVRRLPFFTPLALAAAVVTAATIAALWWLTGGGIASPGALGASPGDGARRGGVRSHAELARRCGACHPSPWSGTTTSALCLDCHDEIRAELAARDGLHARLGRARSCLACHTEHRGATADLTELDPSTFPHDATGFSLARHRRARDGRAFACVDCHDRGLTRWDEGRCESCHRDEQPAAMATHVAAWGAACRDCHDGVDRYSRFDHARTRFALAGKHGGLGCERCHPNARRAGDFANAPDRCVDCHRDDDVHAGRYGADCGRCHDAGGWTPATFDHSTTSFPLTGAHVRVACSGCHEGGRYQGTSTTCVACHPMPADHRGTFGEDCAACHDTTTWEGARFDHRFPLDHGASRPVACKTCHPDGYRAYTCYGCHEHTPARIAGEHREEGISDFRDCVRCHPTGREDEGEHGGEGRDDDD
jgi:hypothetical protein